MPRFVVLEHEGLRGRHWDFMLQWGDALRTWALTEPPAMGRAIRAEPLADHRLAYLDYEGPISGGRGAVKRWDQGTYELLAETADSLELRLNGQRIAGRAQLSRRDMGWVFTLTGAEP
jgi:hypothetical protein